MGATVIKVERPGGDQMRNLGPFYKDTKESLYWMAYNAGKKSITLDIETPEGNRILRELVRTADFVLESFAPGYLKEIALDYNALCQINPRIILVSITPFGQTGPYSKYKASNLTVTALGGYMSICGEPDYPTAPAAGVAPQAFLHAAAAGATGAMIAHYHRELTGEGQHVDVSAQQCVVFTMMQAHMYWPINHVIQKWSGHYFAGHPPSGLLAPLIFPCKDGYVAFLVYSGQFSKSTEDLVAWMNSEGITDELLNQIDWYNLLRTYPPQELYYDIEARMTKFFLTHTKQELYEGALERDIILYPLNTVEDLVNDLQLKARDFWVEIEYPELNDRITFPGPFAKLTEVPIELRNRSPSIGEHNEQIYIRELGFSKEELGQLRAEGII